ncbi:MAG: TolC family protein [Planctomycetaceae bacterium]|nr:TolC family protein [Planctomycetaceae bacterium]
MTVIVMMTSLLLQGCAAEKLRVQYLFRNDQPLSYYEDVTSAIEYPTETEPRKTDEELLTAPRSIRSLDEVEPWEIHLEECIRMALAEATILRDNSVVRSGQSEILQRPQGTASIYDPAIQQTGFLFGNRGYEAALADFDATATTSLTWGRNETPQNAGTLGLASGETQQLETFALQSRIEKPLGNGGTVAVEHDINYEGNNRPAGGLGQQLFPSSYNGLIQAEYRQPLLAGAGVEFNQIAGPLNQGVRGVSGVSQGILISRINGDIALTAFESRVKTLVRDVEDQYWDLHLALRLYQSEIDSFKDLVAYFARLRDRGEGADNILQSEARIYEADARIRGSLADILQHESRLRRLCHLPMNDGKFLYPVDSPSEALLSPDWEASLQEAFCHRHELRQQKWEIKSLELQLKAARSLVRPRLDMVSQYRINGFGDDLAAWDGNPLGSMYQNLGDNDNTGWNFGVQASMPVGLRSARIQVSNYELRLRKNRALLDEMEREIAYELSTSLYEMQRWYELADSTTRRMEASRRYKIAAEDKLLSTENVSPDLFNLLLQAKIQERDAEQAFMRSIVEYNKAINSLRFNKGTTLVDHEIYLAEGNWHPAAAEFALRRAVERTYAKDAHRLRTEPIEFVGGAAPGSWESLGTDSRPFTPGALAGDDQPLQELPGGPMSPVPGAPDFRMPPQDSQGPGAPMLQPPPIEGEVPPMNDSTAPKILEPAPVPPAGDDITGFTPLPDGFLDVPSTSNRDNAGRTRF